MKIRFATMKKFGLLMVGMTVLGTSTVVAQDAPAASAATPAEAQAQVISIFSDHYVSLKGINFNPDWGQSTQVTFEAVAEGDTVMKYDTINYQGTDFGASINVSGTDTLHLDVWAAAAGTFNIYAISPGPVETPVSITTVAGEWVSVNIPLSDFVTEATPVDLTQVFQFKVADATVTTVYFDNIYFKANDPVTAPMIAAPTPTFNADKVLPFFSGAYQDSLPDGINFNPGWGQATLMTFYKISDTDSVIKYENLDYQGTEFPTFNTTGMTHVHVDMWTANATVVNYSLISPGPAEKAYSLPITQGAWVGYDIPLSEFTGVDLTDLFQFKFDVGAAGDSPTIYLDNFYFFNAAVNEEPATAVSGITLANADFTNTISWPASENTVSYNVYYSDAAIDSVDQEGVYLLTRTSELSATHKVVVPHPSLAEGLELHYAVTSVNELSIENEDITASKGSVTGDFEASPFFVEVGADDANTILENLVNGTLSNAGFPAGHEPFVVDYQSNEGELLGAPTDAVDLTAKFWGVFFEGSSAGSFIVIYAEIQDEVQEFTVAENLLSTWGYDGMEYAFGGYQVESFIAGSDHQEMERGAEPDYQFRAGQFTDREDAYLYENFRFESEVPNSLTLSDDLVVDGNVVGYRMLVGINMEQLQGGDGEDILIDLPNGDEMFLMPGIFVAVDADGEGRESQMVSSTRPNLSNQWWNTPAQWNAVAYAGSDVASSNEENGQIAGKFELSQNYPNPFNPTTAINFSIPAAEKVTLEVYNMLGQRVATLVNNVMPAGSHSVTLDASNMASGLYLYKMTAGSFTLSKKMTLVK